MSRFKITVRGTDPRVELRGYIDVERMESLTVFSEAMRGFGIVVASIAEDDYDPFYQTDWPAFARTMLESAESERRALFPKHDRHAGGCGSWVGFSCDCHGLVLGSPESEQKNADRLAGDE
jgi:hypothetical protein